MSTDNILGQKRNLVEDTKQKAVDDVAGENAGEIAAGGKQDIECTS
jgi:hypothetical protein